MADNTELLQDILLERKNTYGKNVRIHEEVWYLAARREVVRSSRILRRRLWGLLPAKATQSVSTPLPVPGSITTEEALRAYVEKQWIR